jgi:hypothetical protein
MQAQWQQEHADQHDSAERPPAHETNKRQKGTSR